MTRPPAGPDTGAGESHDLSPADLAAVVRFHDVALKGAEVVRCAIPGCIIDAFL